MILITQAKSLSLAKPLLVLSLMAGLGLSSPAFSQRAPARPDAANSATEAQQQPPQQNNAARPLPAEKSTVHKLTLPGGLLEFEAKAGTIRLSNAQTGAPMVEIAYIAYLKSGAEVRTRPVTFLFNGGPGYASGWLNLGGIGPWRLPMSGEAIAPSAAPIVEDNADSWLEFTDLVFIDPPGTGYGRILGNDDVRKRLFSVGGDLDALATMIRRWIDANQRNLSPKYLAGESYGGFRVPKLAHLLQTDQGIGVNGLIMLSPVLDFSRFNLRSGLWDYVARLPSYAATLRETKGPIDRNQLKDVEAYAQSDYLLDLMKGPQDKAALDRLSTKLSDLIGLDKTFIRQLNGRISSETFAREFNRATGRISSAYDTRETGFDPYPESVMNLSEDPMRLGLHAPITQAMIELYRSKLNWVVENGRYQFMSEQASRQWDWGNRPNEAIGDLRRSLALDSHMQAIVAHGLTDIVTPYFESKMLLDLMPDFGSSERLKLNVYPGGHMFYTREESRRAFRNDVKAMFEKR
jgi:carboxypeptidase C (cathepsin A)